MMKKRLRKKLRKGEFTEWGFLLRVKYCSTDDREQHLAWLFGVLALVEQRNWMAGGGDTLLICRDSTCRDSTLTNETIDAFCADLLKLPGVEGYRRSEPVDANELDGVLSWPPLIHRS